jgi:potassium-transporting ATPase KdpC subunit
MARQLRSAVIAVLVLSVALGLAYPLAITGLAQLLWPSQAGGSLVRVHGEVVGSSLIGQSFAGMAGDLQSRPSAVGDDPSATGGSNLGPNSALLAREIRARLRAYLRRERPFDPGLAAAEVPADAVTASGSGVDPGISVANARIQAFRVAAVRRTALALVLRVIAAHTSGGGLLGGQQVDVLAVNLALDALAPR